MAEHKAGPDLAHSLLVMRNIARFHASPIALREKRIFFVVKSQDQKELMKYKKGIFHKDQPTSWKEMYSENLRTLADETVNWSELDPKIPMKIRKLSDVLFEKGDGATAYREDDFNVLNHGDAWINNMMFRYDEDHNPIDHMFVDFQFCHWGSPAEDILYFIGTSLADDVRIQHRDLLLRNYQASLTSTMAELKCKTEELSFDKLQQTLKERAFCEAIAAMTVLVAALLGKEDKMKLDEILRSGGAFIKPGYDGRAFKTTMTRLLPLYDSMGAVADPNNPFHWYHARYHVKTALSVLLFSDYKLGKTSGVGMTYFRGRISDYIFVHEDRTAISPNIHNF
ncbi:uncharacterized protein LOC124413628 [Diprion similis]|uniref:uncharacterized protein LOC124413628 n=1 Tax=Diprion similis TaxID=362088 RepID=UPI001EF7C86E|nr:uncharacterized protein LOC124413628 [Diprion similis]